MSDPTRSHFRKSRPLMLAAACTMVAGVLFSTAAPAQEEEERESGLIDNIMRGLGARSMDNSGIDYRERSPLVVPPTTDLPAPETARSANAANWPKDPDVARRKADIANSRKAPRNRDDAAAPLRPSELNIGARAGSSSSSGRDTSRPGEDGANPLSSSQLGGKNLFGNILSPFKQETATFDGEPARSSLIQPPAGYQTPSPSQPYGLNMQRSIDEAAKERETKERDSVGQGRQR